MLQLLYNFPRTKPFILACSGGVDSMAAADYFARGNKNFSLAYFNHGTPQANDMQEVVVRFSRNRNIHIDIGYLQSEKDPKQSPEEFFRNERYRWLISLEKDIVTCHHLNDAVEGYLFSTMHGNPKLIKSCIMISSYGQNATVYRPFLLNTKSQLIDWCVKNNVNWCEDVSNNDTKYPRNFIRHKLIKECLNINPGLFKTIRKKIIKDKYNHGTF